MRGHIRRRRLLLQFDLLDSITLSDTEALLTQTVTQERAALSVVAPEEA